MLIKLITSFLGGVAFIYLLFCLFLLSPIAGGGNPKELSKDVRHRWFWVMSMYIGHAIMWIFMLTIVIGIPYIFLYGGDW
jgi:hypothetical protein